jgi:hypothetical protein
VLLTYSKFYFGIFHAYNSHAEMHIISILFFSMALNKKSLNKSLILASILFHLTKIVRTYIFLDYLKTMNGKFELATNVKNPL